jgi:hypothetical protein
MVVLHLAGSGAGAAPGRGGPAVGTGWRGR